MARQCLLLDLNDDADLIAAYRDRHQPGNVPAAVIADIRRRGIESMEIWQIGDRLAMIIETNGASTAHPPVNTDPEIAAWEQAMDRFQRRLPFAEVDTKWVAAERIFDLAEHSS